MEGGSRARWLPLALLALLAAADFTAQYLFTATQLPQALGIPDAVLSFIQVVLTLMRATVSQPVPHKQAQECITD